MKILAIIPGNKKNQGMIFCKNQIKAIKKEGINIHEFYLISRTSPLIILKEILKFRKMLKKIKPDIIHSHYGTMTSFFAAISSFKPLIITFRGSDLNPTPCMNFLRNSFRNFLSQISTIRAKKIICVSKKLKNRIWFRKDKISIIPSGIDTKLFYPMGKNIARKKLKVKKSEKIIIFNAGNQTQERLKRLDIAKQIYHKIKKKIPNLKIIIFKGETPHDKIPVYLNAADCLLLTSDYEGSPNIVKEAIACNLPVVSFDVGDVRERLKKVCPSKIVDRNAEEAAKAVIKILKLNKRSNGSLTTKEFEQDVIVKKIIEIYKDLE